MKEQSLQKAAEAIREGLLVAMPTETVYGLACDATQSSAAQSIFLAKGRPSDNPLIVHIPHVSWLSRVAASVPDQAFELGRHFWPGPLTIVLPKADTICDEVTAGRQTVAVRIPDHAMATELMTRSDRPIAAPSANLFTHLSPTRIEHLSPEIRAACAVILDGGQCRVGIESTIVDMTSETPRILRHGQITKVQIEAVLGVPVEETHPNSERIAPGMYEKHYSPNTPVRLVEKLDARQSGLTFGSPQNATQVHMPSDPGEYAFELYAALFEMDQKKLSTICIEEPPRTPEWSAIWERLLKAKSSG